jgi:orotidine-5'-phosphate decarboxylase
VTADPSRHFGQRLARAVEARRSQIVLGIDPDPARLWPAAVERTSEARARLAATLSEVEEAAAEVRERAEERTDQGVVARLETAAAVLAHCLALIDAAGPACVAIKPQLACFERLGAPGWLALEHIAAHARARGLLVLADGKRGDVPVTAAAYAQALVGGTPSPFGTVPGLEADAFTANPLLGRDALEPLIVAARARGAGAFVLVRTSNPGAADVLDLPLATGERLWERLAALVHELGAEGPGEGLGSGSAGGEARSPGETGARAETGRPAETGAPRAGADLADVGAVVGATEPQHLARARELMPRTPFLLPGIGAQGGDVDTLGPAFSPGRAAALITASRSIANAHEANPGTPAEAARAEAERLRERAWSLA